MTTTPKQPQPPTRAQPRRDDRGMTGNQKLILAVLAFLAFIALLTCTAMLANIGQALAAGFTGTAASGALIALFKLLLALVRA